MRKKLKRNDLDILILCRSIRTVYRKQISFSYTDVQLYADIMYRVKFNLLNDVLVLNLCYIEE